MLYTMSFQCALEKTIQVLLNPSQSIFHLQFFLKKIVGYQGISPSSPSCLRCTKGYTKSYNPTNNLKNEIFSLIKKALNEIYINLHDTSSISIKCSSYFLMFHLTILRSCNMLMLMLRYFSQFYLTKAIFPNNPHNIQPSHYKKRGYNMITERRYG